MDRQSKPEKPKTARVGYCNPPQHTRFKTGQSGNPQGRPKGTLNLATVLARTLRERVVINEGGRRKAVTKLEAAIKQLTNKAASGDLKALQLLAALMRSAEERAIQADAPNSALDEGGEALPPDRNAYIVAIREALGFNGTVARAAIELAPPKAQGALPEAKVPDDSAGASITRKRLKD